MIMKFFPRGRCRSKILAGQLWVLQSTPYSTRITIRLQDFVAVSERISIQLAKVPVKVQQAAPGRGCASPAW